MENGLEVIKNNVNQILTEIKNSNDVSFIKNVQDKIKLAREWAKIQKSAEEIYTDLLKIEIECFKKIVELDCLKILNANIRPVAIFFSEKTKSEISDLIKNNSGKSAFVIYKDFTRQQIFDNHKNIGKHIFERNESITFENLPEEKNIIKEYALNVSTGIAMILDDFASSNQCFSIEEMADHLLLEYHGKDKKYIEESGMIQGVREMCRKAVSSAKTFILSDLKIPRFITCIDRTESTLKWLRIPTENANLIQFKDMIDLRKEQLKQDEKNLENLITIFTELKEIQETKFKNKTVQIKELLEIK